MSDFIILTDSSADLGADLTARYDIQVLPLSFIVAGETFHNYPDNREMAPEVFYQKMREGVEATTSAVNVGQYTDFLEPQLQAGRDVLILSFSSALSVTCSASQIAAEELREQYPQRKIYVVDTLCASLGQGLLVCLAAQERAKGRTIEEVRDFAEANKTSVCHQFTVDDLSYLKRGGRISAATAVVGTLLRIKPLLHVNEVGKLTSTGKARGREAALKALVDAMERTITHPADQTIFLSHSDCLADAQKVAQMAKERLGVKDAYINSIGPVIGAHTGPGTVALFYLGAAR